jgi:hypothetical protein
VADPRIYQGTPLAEVPLEWLRRRDPDDDPARRQGKATEVAPGVRVLVLAWGDMLGPDGTVSRGARIAVWQEDPAEPPVIDMGYLSLPGDLQAALESGEPVDECEGAPDGEEDGDG